MVLASTPLLFAGVSSRQEPWYGSFTIERLQDLTLAEGTELVRRRALDREDHELAAFVLSPLGQVRMQVVERLGGGSPGLWHLVAEAVNVPSLEALTPAVEKLMDGDRGDRSMDSC